MISTNPKLLALPTNPDNCSGSLARVRQGAMRRVKYVGCCMALFVTPVHAAEFDPPRTATTTTYNKGVWTQRLSITEFNSEWTVGVTNRDPWSFKEQSGQGATITFRSDGSLAVARGQSLSVWEAPHRLIDIDRTGLRKIYQSELPIVQLGPEYLEANRIVLKAAMKSALKNGAAPESLSVTALQDGKLTRYDFRRSESALVRVGDRQVRVWRMGGEKPDLPGMYADARLKLLAPVDLLIAEKGELVGWSNPKADQITVVEGYQDASIIGLWRQTGVSQPEFTSVVLEEHQIMPMSDYVPLVATVIVPGDEDGKALPGPFPTLLIRTPYDRKAFITEAWKYVSRGYAVVSQDVRGRYDSAGFFHAIHDDISDGNDTLNWIAAQGWSDGNVGMFGGSYNAWVQWQAAASGNKHLKALISIATTSTAFGDLPYVNGLFGAGILTWSIYVGATADEMAQAFAKDLNAIASELPLIDADLRAVGHKIPFWRYWVTHSKLDEYWQQGNMLNHQKKIDQPVLHVTGWYDDVLRGTMTAWDMMKANGRKNQHLIVGPWPHLANSTRGIAELKFGPDSVRADLEYTYVRWFDRWLKGKKNGIDTEPAVNYFTMTGGSGEGQWRTADTWPPPDTTAENWYLHSSGNANTPAGGASLKSVQPGEEPPDQYIHDPAHPVPYLVDIRANQLSAPEDYQEVEQRHDTLEYTTEPFEKAYEITGEAKAVVYAATDQRDTDWVVRVTDVFPDGRSINLIDGYLRARFRKGMETEVLVPPGEVIRYDIPMTWTSYRFAPGHRMRVIIASAAAGVYVVNTNTGNDMGTDTEMRIAKQTIHHSAKYPSHITVSARRKGSE